MTANDQLPEREQIAETRLQDIIDLLPATFYVINAAGRMVLWNRRVEQATQLTSAEVAAMQAEELFGLEERALVGAKIGEVIRNDGEVVLEAGLQSKNGQVTPYLFTGSRFISHGKPYVCGMGVDISERRRQDEQLRMRDRALHASSNGIFIVRRAGAGLTNQVEYVNPAFERITGFRADEIIGIDSQAMCGFMSMPGMDDDERAQVRRAMQELREVRVTLRNLRRNGEIFWNDLTVAPVFNDKRIVTHFVGVINDVTESKQRTSYLEHEINHDGLTGLANRNLMWDRLEHAIHVAQRNKSLVAVILVDLDNFKVINDTLGHDAGDEVLRIVARKMSGSVRDSDTVARLGGDEFVLILADQPSLRYTLRMIDRLRKDMATAVSVNNKEVPIESSMGVSVYPHDGACAGELIQSADAAMYRAKAAGRNDVQFFSPDMKAATTAKQKLQAGLRHAIENGEMFLVFQPKLSLRTNRIIGAEALLRWQHPEQGVLLPASFMLEAEESGLIVSFGEWVCDHICEALKRMKALGFGDLVLSMNVSFRELSERGYISLLGEKLRQSELPPQSFELEITESNLLRNAEQTQGIFAEIGRQGIRLTVDEFGAGVSSLKNLHQLPVTNLKIFKSYVSTLGVDTFSDMMARTIIGVGHLMNMSVIGECVETPDQRDFLQSNGCDQIQGNFFSEPVRLAAFEQLIVDTNRAIA